MIWNSPQISIWNRKIELFNPFGHPLDSIESILTESYEPLYPLLLVETVQSLALVRQAMLARL